MTVALVDRGHVVQVWHGCRAAEIDTSRLTGTLVEVAGDVHAGMAYRDGCFWTAPPRPEAEAIRAEAVRRIESVFPPALQTQLARMGGAFTERMFGYTHGVHSQAQTFLALDAAPADFADDRHWPAIPDLDQSPVPIALPAPAQVHQAAVPVEVRVVMEGLRSEAQAVAQPLRVVEHIPEIKSGRTEIYPPVSEADTARAKADALAELARLTEKHRAGRPDDWVRRVARVAVDRVLSADLATLPATKTSIAEYIACA